jgi:predicted DNA-binding transcriptional regulator YafY
MADPLSSVISKKSWRAKRPKQRLNKRQGQNSAGAVGGGAGTVLSVDLAAMNWEGVEVPTGKLRERMEHIDKVLQPIRRRDDGTMELPSAEDLGRGIRVGEKTMRETIQTMQDLYNIPVRYNAQRFGYEYTEDVVFAPWLQLSESELVALYLTQHLGELQGTTFRTRLQSAFRKVAALYGKGLSFDRRLLDECFSFFSAGDAARFHPEHLDTSCRAMLRQEELVLNYTKQNGEGAGVPELRRVWPLHVTYREFAWYVLSHDLLRDDVRLFMVTRINGIEETRTRFERPKGFDARKHLKKAFKVFMSGEAEDVVLKFSPSAAVRLRERRGHETRKLRELGEGWLEMRMRVPISPDLVGWIASFLDECEVVGPGRLREHLAERMRKALERVTG